MGDFDDLLAADAGFFVSADNGGELIQALAPGGVSRDVYGNIMRRGPRLTPEAAKVYAMKIDVEVINNAVTGVSAAATDLIGTVLRIQERAGQAARKDFTNRHESIVKQDAGMIYLSF